MHILPLIFCLLPIVEISQEHAIFREPPSRASIGLLRPHCKLLQNPDDNGVYCGGLGVQHNSINQGKCGICGDVFSAPVKDHQAGGKFSTGTIARSYRPGEVMSVEIDLVANHLGFFTFAICSHNNMHTSPDRDCFINNPSCVF